MMLRQPDIAPCIPFWSIGGIMRKPVNLNRQIGPCAKEIERKGSGWVLFPDFMSTRRLSQQLPQYQLRLG
jgi:hypothetical protein